MAKAVQRRPAAKKSAKKAAPKTTRKAAARKAAPKAKSAPRTATKRAAKPAPAPRKSAPKEAPTAPTRTWDTGIANWQTSASQAQAASLGASQRAVSAFFAFGRRNIEMQRDVVLKSLSIGRDLRA